MSAANAKSLAVIFLAGALVFLIRYTGLVLGDRLPKTGFFKRLMDALPGTVFAALVFPGLVDTGWPGAVAAAVIFVATRKTGNVMVAMLLGMATVAMLRI